MITKLFRATVLLLALALLTSMPLSAGQVKPHAKIFLRCWVLQDGNQNPRIVIVNNTKSTIPQGTAVYWVLCGGGGYLSPATGSRILEVALPPDGNFSSIQHPTCGGQYSPKAWYWK